MSLIKYTEAKNDRGEVVHWVHLGRTVVGLIRRHADGGYFYQPKNSKDASPHFSTLAECKRSLESDGD